MHLPGHLRIQAHANALADPRRAARQTLGWHQAEGCGAAS